MTTAASCRAVFSTAELLERILLHLPSSTFLLAQRICRQFRDLLTTSPQLQQHLFLRTHSDTHERWTIGRDRSLVKHCTRLQPGQKVRTTIKIKKIPQRLNPSSSRPPWTKDDTLTARLLASHSPTSLYTSPPPPSNPATSVSNPLGT